MIMSDQEKQTAAQVAIDYHHRARGTVRKISEDFGLDIYADWHDDAETITEKLNAMVQKLARIEEAANLAQGVIDSARGVIMNFLEGNLRELAGTATGLSCASKEYEKVRIGVGVHPRPTQKTEEETSDHDRTGTGSCTFGPGTQE